MRMRHIPIGPGINGDRYMRQTTNTSGAAERAEGAVYGESAFNYTEETSPIQTVGAFVPTTKEILADEPRAESMLDTDLQMQLMRRVENQFFNGDGTSPNLRGVNNIVGVNAHAAVADDSIQASILKAAYDVKFTGQATPDYAFIAPEQWLTLSLEQDTTGKYLTTLIGQIVIPGLPGVMTMESQFLASGQAVVGDFGAYCYIRDRQSVEVYVMERMAVASALTVPTGQKNLVADARLALTFTRPTAFTKITGLS